MGAVQMILTTPVLVSIGQAGFGEGPAARSDIIQEVVVLDGMDWKELEKLKTDHMYAHLRKLLANPAHKVLVFVNMKTMAWELAEKMCAEGFQAEHMYGGR